MKSTMSHSNLPYIISFPLYMIWFPEGGNKLDNLNYIIP